ncbi:MAG: NAD(P)H-hydrate dehydratase [Clostridia bacterium]|nr:NAD(P)H-hydrate dehydratase [Clostridia bacterium]
MINVSTNEFMRELDRHMIEDIGIPSAVLMENAAHAVSDAVLSCAASGRCVILIGPGNNGGDGLAVLRRLVQQKRSAVGILLCDPEKLKDDARLNYDIAVKLALPLTQSLDAIETADIIVDALFGTGFDRELSGSCLEAIERANASNAYRIAVDIPSGINGTSGKAFGTVFNADETVSFVAAKRGHLITNRLECVGRLKIVQIGMADEAHMRMLEREQLVDREFAGSLLPERKRYSNKGDHGRALVIGGSPGMSGAPVMAAAACIRAGAGLTRAIVPEQTLPAFAALPEAMVLKDTEADLAAQLEWAGAVCIGCGMGADERAASKLEALLASGKRAVIDADALNLMSNKANRSLLSRLSAKHIITPHPGEMARLLGSSVAEVLAGPVRAASGFAEEHGCIVLLKNAVSVIASPDGRLRYNSSGNAGLAKGGSGDCLGGIVTALLAQGLEPFDAASVGAYLLGASADEALELLKTRALAAGDVISALAQMLAK